MSAFAVSWETAEGTSVSTTYPREQLLGPAPSAPEITWLDWLLLDLQRSGFTHLTIRPADHPDCAAMYA